MGRYLLCCWLKSSEKCPIFCKLKSPQIPSKIPQLVGSTPHVCCLKSSKNYQFFWVKTFSRLRLISRCPAPCSFWRLDAIADPRSPNRPTHRFWSNQSHMMISSIRDVWELHQHKEQLKLRSSCGFPLLWGSLGFKDVIQFSSASLHTAGPLGNGHLFWWFPGRFPRELSRNLGSLPGNFKWHARETKYWWNPKKQPVGQGRRVILCSFHS